MADWEIPSSRESVDASSAWNQWLRDEVPTVLLTAAKAFVKRALAITTEAHTIAEVSASAGLCDEAVHMLSCFLQCVPTREQATEFFAPLATTCCSILRACRMLPTCNGSLASPEEVVIWRSLEHDQASGKTGDLLRHVGLVPLHPEVQMSDALADGLGVRKLDARLLCELLAALISQNEDLDHDWLAWAFEQLQRDANLSLLLPTLRTLSLIPLSGGGWSCTSQAPIYEIDDANRLLSRLEGLGLLQSISSLRLAHPAFLRAVAERRDARCLLSRLKVNKLSTHELVMDHVLPALAAKNTPSDALPGLLAFARFESLSCANLAAELPGALLSRGAQLLSTDGSRFTLQRLEAEVPVALNEQGAALQLCPALCGPDEDLLPESGLSTLDWPTISDHYHLLVAGDDGDTARRDPAGWRAFFLALGVDSFPAVLPVASPGRPSNDNTVEADAAGSVSAYNWESPALEALLSELVRQANIPLLERLLAVLLERWPMLQARGALRDADHTETRLLQTLRGHRWLAAASDGTLHHPNELWLPTSELLEVLVGSVPYVRAELPAQVATTLGVQTTLSPLRVVHLLADWADAAEHSAHVADPVDLTSMYIWLGAHATTDEEVRKRLLGCRSIWVPRRFSSATSAVQHSVELSGDFFAPHECVWKDETDLIEGDPSSGAHDKESAASQLTCQIGLRVLSCSYPVAAREAFAQLGVPEHPPLEVYFSILRAAPNVSGGAPAEALAATLRVFALLGSWAKAASAAGEGDVAGVADAAGGGLLEEMRIAVHAGDGVQLPVATNEWAEVDQVYFFMRATETTEWTEKTLKHAVIVPDVSDETFEDNVQTFLLSVVGLSSLVACVREGIDMAAMPPVEHMEHANRSARMVAMAGVMQRLTAGHSDPLCNTEQREALKLLLSGLRFHVAESIQRYQQICVPRARDSVLERKLLLGTPPCRAFLWLPDALSGTEGDAEASTHGCTAAAPVAVLFTTAQAQPRDLIVQLSKLLPHGLQASASLSLFPVLHHVWEYDVPTPALAAILLGDQHGLNELPSLPAGETLWLDGNVSSEDAMSAAMVQAQLREQQLVLSKETTAIVPLGPQAAEDVHLDPVLLNAIHGREAARTAAREKGLPRNPLAMVSRGAAPSSDAALATSGAPFADDSKGSKRSLNGEPKVWNRLPPFPSPPPLPRRQRQRASLDPESSTPQDLAARATATHKHSLEEATNSRAGDGVQSLALEQLEVTGPIRPEILALPGLSEIDRGKTLRSALTLFSRWTLPFCSWLRTICLLQVTWAAGARRCAMSILFGYLATIPASKWSGSMRRPSLGYPMYEIT